MPPILWSSFWNKPSEYGKSITISVIYDRKKKPDTPNSFGEIIFENVETLQRIYGLIKVLSPSNIVVISFLIACKERNIAQINQLSQRLDLICACRDTFYGLLRMLMSKNVYYDVSKDSKRADVPTQLLSW